jgi:hypothetical protein
VDSEREDLEFNPLSEQQMSPVGYCCVDRNVRSGLIVPRATAWLTETATKSPATSLADADLLKTVKSARKPPSSRAAQSGGPPKERITEILERLLESNEADRGATARKRKK